MHRKIVGFLLILGGLLALPNLAAFAAQPPSSPLRTQDLQPLDGVPQLVMPAVDNAKELTAYQSAPKDAPLVFAVPLAAKVDTSTEGVWDVLPGDVARWRLRVLSAGAHSLNFGFTTYRMPPGGQLTVSDILGAQLVGPYTDADNESHGELWTPLVYGEEALIEVLVPVAARDQLALELTSVNHGFLDPFNPPEKNSGACNVDVACSQSAPWQAQVDSVARILIGGSGLCTGALINNTANDRKSLFLTADHCGITAQSAATIVSYWNYENSTCRPVGSAGGAGNGSLAQTLTGAFLRAEHAPSDMTLLELDDPVPANYNPFWAGWDRTGADATSAVAVHHPRGQEKRISFENQATTVTSYGGSAVPGGGTHIRVADWDLGTTEPGSSGSPLFDQNGRIIGQLHGGGAACGNDLSDWYGRVFTSWTGGGTNATRLSNWLDPVGTGATVLNGIGPVNAGFSLSANPATATFCTGGANAATTITIARSGDAGAIDLSATGLPGAATATFAPDPVPGGATSATLTFGNLAGVAAGNYPITISGAGSSGTSTTNLTLSVSSTPVAPSLTAPAAGATGVAVRPTFSWGTVAGAASYVVEIATDAGFTNIVVTAPVAGTSFTPAADLATGTAYFWRARAINGCGSTPSAAATFTTASTVGVCPAGTTPQTVLNQDFSAGLGAWTTGGTGSTWAITTARPSPGSGGNAVRATTPATITDQLLTTPPITIPAAGEASNATLQFQNYQDFESRSAGGCWDGGMVEVSTDNGATWTQVPGDRLLNDPYNGALGNTGNTTGNPLGGRQAWCGDTQDWINAVIDISQYAGQTVRFRFRVATDNSVGREGWTIDDVRVQTCQVAAPPPPPPAQRFLYLPQTLR